MKNWKQTVFLRLFVTFLLIMVPIYTIGFSIYNWGVRAIRTELNNSMIAQAAFYLNSLETEMQRIKVLQYDCITDENLDSLTYASLTMDNFERAQAMLRLQQRLYSIKNSSEYIEDVIASIATLDTTVSAVNGIQKRLDSEIIRTLDYPGMSPSSQFKYHEGKFYSNARNVYSKAGNAPFAFMITVTLSGARIEGELAQFGAYRGGVTLLTSENNDFLFAGKDAAGQAETLRKALILNSGGDQSGTYFESIGGKRYVAVFSRNEFTGFLLARYIPVGHWNAWFDGLLLMNHPENYPLQSYLQTIVTRIEQRLTNLTTKDIDILSVVSDRTTKSAQIFLAALPILSVYPFYRSIS